MFARYTSDVLAAGRGKAFDGFFTVKDRCDICSYRFEREEGYCRLPGDAA